MAPRVNPIGTITCERCGHVFEGQSLKLCMYCMIADMEKAKQKQIEDKPMRYVMQYGRQAVVEFLRDRWCDR